MFDSLTIVDPRPIVWLKRVFLFLIVVFLAIGAVSSYRAYVQVRSLELSAPRSLSVGSIVKTAVVISGRTTVDVEVDLVQGAHSERLVALQVRGNEFGFFDPRSRHGSESVTLTREMLSQFVPGRALIRSVATGRHQWMRLPPPTVREIEVDIQQN
jgi:hypothetical protein